MMNGYRETDSFIVSEKPLNKIGDNKPMAEEVEKRCVPRKNLSDNLFNNHKDPLTVNKTVMVKSTMVKT